MTKLWTFLSLRKPNETNILDRKFSCCCKTLYSNFKKNYWKLIRSRRWGPSFRGRRPPSFSSAAFSGGWRRSLSSLMMSTSWFNKNEKGWCCSIVITGNLFHGNRCCILFFMIVRIDHSVHFNENRIWPSLPLLRRDSDSGNDIINKTIQIILNTRIFYPTDRGNVNKVHEFSASKILDINTSKQMSSLS